ncbi:Fc.00g000310.m01.CDS01 [Cosmosporella sp. VM-42]
MSSAVSFRQIIGVPPSTASPQDSTLVIIDAQNEYAEGKLKVSNASESRKVIQSLLQRYRDANGLIVHVVHDTPDGAPVFTPGTKLAEEFEELVPNAGEKVVHKKFPSSFADTDLQQHLESVGSRRIVLVGYMVGHFILSPCFNLHLPQAHVCISTTAREGARLGYDVLVVEDAVGDRDIPGVDAEQLVQVALSEIGDAFGTIVPSDNIY